MITNLTRIADYAYKAQDVFKVNFQNDGTSDKKWMLEHAKATMIKINYRFSCKDRSLNIYVSNKKRRS